LKILFTGAGGFLGRYAAPRLAREHEVVGTYLNNDVPLDGVRLVRLDLEDAAARARLLERERPDCVVHAAAMSRPSDCEADPERAERVNAGATQWLCASALRLIFFSTDLVFDGKYPPYREEDPPAPSCVYSRLKVDGERAVLARTAPAMTLRLALGYGWKPTGHSMFCDSLYRSLRRGEPMTLFSDQFRSALYMKDAAEILARLLALREWPEAGGRLLHCGGPESVSRVRFGREFCSALGLDDSLVEAKTMAEAGVRAAPDCTLKSERLYSLIGFRPRTIEAGVADMALENPYK